MKSLKKLVRRPTIYYPPFEEDQNKSSSKPSADLRLRLMKGKKWKIKNAQFYTAGKNVF